MIEQDNGQMPIVCGIDLVEYELFARCMAVGGNRFLQRVYTEQEQTYCAGRLPCLAARFAAKEAVSKALGTGMRGVHWQEIATNNNRRGKPFLFLSGQAASIAAALQLEEWSISLSHAENYAVAIAVALKRDIRIGAEIEEVISSIQRASLEQPSSSATLLELLERNEL